MLQINLTPFPTLTTQRLILREITSKDVKEIFMLRSSKTVMQFIDRPFAITEEDALEYIKVISTNLQNNNGITWGIALKDNNELIGTIGFWRIEKENFRAEIGYMLSENHQRKGIMQETITVALDYAFNTMKLHSIEATVKPGNDASSKLLAKNNFVLEGNFKENYYFNGAFYDSLIYSLLTPNK